MYIQDKLPEYKVLAVKLCLSNLKRNPNYLEEIIDNTLKEVIIKIMNKKA